MVESRDGFKQRTKALQISPPPQGKTKRHFALYRVRGVEGVRFILANAILKVGGEGLVDDDPPTRPGGGGEKTHSSKKLATDRLNFVGGKVVGERENPVKYILATVSWISCRLNGLGGRGRTKPRIVTFSR